MSSESMSGERRSREQLDARAATICAQLTPRGRGAVAVVAILGAQAEPLLDQLFEPANGKPYSRSAARKVVYGIWKSTGEDLIVYRRGDQLFEVHCHGGNTASTAIIESLRSLTVTEVSPGDFSQTLEDPWKVGVQGALSRATTKRSAELLLIQMELLPESIERLRQMIASNDRDQALTVVETMLKWSSFGFHLTQPRSIVLCGQPNVGKSSLVNAIVGFQRAIVHDVAGTTRDVVSQSTAINGWPVELKDTAGLRTATNSIEEIGIEKAKSEIEAADLKICVFDDSQVWTDKEQEMVAFIKPQLTVYNKSDLVEAERDPDQRPRGVVTSATTGDGIEGLIERIGSMLVPSIPDSNQPFPVTAEQIGKLEQLAQWARDANSDEPPIL